MRVAVVYESMFGNTHKVAEAVADGLRSHHDTTVLSVSELAEHRLDDVGMIVVGGPTHMWGMSRPSSRDAAAKQAAEPARALILEPHATEPGLREWLAGADLGHIAAATFDTRMNMPALIAGSAARPIEHALQRAGCRIVARRRSFVVTKQNRLAAGELDRARTWGETLAATLSRVTGVSA